MPTATTYHVVAQCPFSRREGPWPRRAFQPAERQRIFRDTAQRLEDQLEQYGLFRWYRDVAGVKRDPRRKKKGEPHAFGLVPLVLTPAQFQRLRRAMPEVLALPRRPFRIPKPGRLASSTNIVPNASEANFWHIPAIGLDTARRANPHRLGQGIKVAVIDSGVDRIHREFSGKTIEAIEFDSVTGKFLRFGGSDDDGHGTHVASLIAGEKAGVAPQADLVSVSVFRNRQAQPEAVVAALAWVKEQHVHVINLSAGFRPNTEVFASVVNQICVSSVLRLP